MHKLKKSLIAIAAAAAVGTSGFFGWRYYADSHVPPIKVYPFSYVGMTEYWGDRRESYGSVTTDRIQTVYLSNTQTVSEILVKKDQQVKKGDLLMRFDTTLSQLEVERKELEIQKNQMDLEEAQKELQRISWMVPMGTPPREPETEPPQPTVPSYKIFNQGDYEVNKSGGHDGSSRDAAFICWLAEGKVISKEFLQETIGTLVPTEPTDPTEPSTEPTDQTDPSTEPTDPSTEPSTEPSTAPTDPTTEPSTAPTEPTTEPATEAPTENPTQESTEPATAPVETPVQVTFYCTPVNLNLTVYPADKDINSAIQPQKAGIVYNLLPGEYIYLASAEGYETAQQKFTVPAQQERFRVDIILTQTATEAPATEPTTETVAETTATEATTEPATEAPATEPIAAETIAETTATEPATEAPAAEAPVEAPAAEASTEAPALTGLEQVIAFADFLPTEETPTAAPEEPTAPAQPEKKCQPYYAVLKVTRDNQLRGDTVVWLGVHVNEDGSFSFFDASQMEDYSFPPLPEQPTEPTQPDIGYIGSGYTYSEIQKMKKEQEQKIKDLEIQLKLSQADLKIMQRELSDGNIYAEQDGKVISLLTEEEAKLNSQPIMKVSSGGGYYIDATIGELERDTVKIGQEVSVSDWESGGSYTGTVVSVGDIPSSSAIYSAMSNPTSTSYPFRVFVDESADLKAGSYVSISYSAAEKTGVYLEKPFLRTEGGESFVYVRGEDGLLERRTVTVGKSQGGYYMEILDGLTADDYVAFPYGKNLKPGAPTEEGDYSDMYS